MSNYNKGDMVQVVDGSYSLTIKDGDFCRSYGIDLMNRDFEVLHTDLKLPASSSDDQFNTMIIKAKDNNQIVYTQERMVIPSEKIIEPVIINFHITTSSNYNAEQFAKTIAEYLKNNNYKYNMGI